MPDRTRITNKILSNWNDVVDNASRAPEETEEAISELTMAVLVVGAEVCYCLEAIEEELRGLRKGERR